MMPPIKSHHLKDNPPKLVTTPKSVDTHRQKHNQHPPTETQTELGLAFSDMTSGTIPIGMRAEGIWSRGARGRVVRHDQIRDGVKVAEREEGTL